MPDSIPASTRFAVAERDISACFEALGDRVLTQRDIASILAENRDSWRTGSATAGDLIEYLESQGKLRRHILRSETYADITRYSWGDVSPYTLGLGIRPGAYLSHTTALSLHGLTEQVPAVIYVNKEQRAKTRTEGTLTQEGINRAFSRPQRESQLVYRHERWRYVVISGKFTADLEVGEILGPTGESLRATKLERTLIDVAVRPAYAGGVSEVLTAYRSARERLRAPVLLATLKRLDYVYPYHQAIGFYLDRAGYPSTVTERFRALGLDFDFYLTHGAQSLEYDPTWRLHVPTGL